MQEVVSWFKGIDLFRQAEFERMIERKPTPLDKRYHKTWLAALIAEGERLLTEIRRTGGLPRGHAGIKLSDVEATVEELCDTQAEWHGSLSAARRVELFKRLFNGPLRIGERGAEPEDGAPRKTGCPPRSDNGQSKQQEPVCQGAHRNYRRCLSRV